MRILGIAGSLRAGSHNAALLRAAAKELPRGLELVEWDGLRAVPPYDEDAEADVPAAVADLRDAIAAADAVLIATPEYNGSIPGVLKNAIDWASRPRATTPLAGKPAAVIGASTGAFGAVWAQADLRRVLEITGARVLDHELPVGFAPDRFDAAGRLVDDDTRDALREIVGDLVAAAAPASVAA